IETSLSAAYKISIEKHNETIKKYRYVVSRLIYNYAYLGNNSVLFFIWPTLIFNITIFFSILYMHGRKLGERGQLAP
ncbi:zinc finger MYM-type protein 1-like isoform X1, partial [Aphis craccivora]